MRKCFEAHGHDSGVGVGGVKVTVLIRVFPRISTGVRVLILGNNTKERGVGEGQRLNGPAAASLTPTMKWVGRAAV